MFQLKVIRHGLPKVIFNLSTVLCAIDIQLCDISTHDTASKKVLKHLSPIDVWWKSPCGWNYRREGISKRCESSLSFCHCFLLSSPNLPPSLVVITVIFSNFCVFCGRKKNSRCLFNSMEKNCFWGQMFYEIFLFCFSFSVYPPSASTSTFLFRLSN